MSEKKELNPQQKQAVEHGEGPLLIVAGAGTGKTTVITERIKFLITRKEVKPAEILALTFTNKAAWEMEERVDQALPYGHTDMWISTFHNFCDRVLRQEAIQIGLNPAYKLMSQSETIKFLTDRLFQFNLDFFRPLGNPNKFVQGMVAHFSRLRDEDVTPKEYERFAKQQAKLASSIEEKEEAVKTEELASAFKFYEELKIKAGLMDFSDLIVHTLSLFRKRKSVLARYQEQFKYVLVDEFQDTNYAQYALLKLLAPPGKKANLAVVGDDSQAVYKFRGAAISNILQFMEDYKEAVQVVLIKNYRSSQVILDHAYRLIKHNDPDTLEVKLGIDKNLRAVRKTKEAAPEFFYRARVEDEAEAVVKKIINLKKKEGFSWQEFAILVRANNHASPFSQALARQGVPYQFLGPGQLFHQPEVKDLIAYLKVLACFEDDPSFYRILSMDQFEITGRDLAALGNFARKNNISLFETGERVEEVFIAKAAKEKIGKVIEMVHRHLERVPKETAGQLVYYFLEDSGLLHRLANYDSELTERQAQNISKFFDRLKTYEVDHDDASAQAVVNWLVLSMELGESPLAADIDWTQEDKVNLLTVHSAKGLEFPVVFLVNLVAARFPTRRRSEQIPIPEPLIKEILPAGDFHQQEERRLFYVGMTRAQDRLFLTAAHYYGEGKREKKLSPFVCESLGKEDQGLKSLSGGEKQLSIFDYSPAIEEDQSQNIKKAPLLLNYLSYSQINTFSICPLKYRYQYLQKIPTPSSPSLSLGSSVHQTLRDFYQLRKRGETVDQKRLLSLLDQQWISQGYTSRAYEEKAKASARRMLGRFFEETDPDLVPLAVEEGFVVRLSPTLKVGGRIDRVDKTSQGLRVIDYKTGRTMDQKDIDSSLQMTIYALAVADRGIFGVGPERVELVFHFLETGEKKKTVRTKEQLAAARKEILDQSEKISQSEFQATPGFSCRFCEYKMICEAWADKKGGF